MKRKKRKTGSRRFLFVVVILGLAVAWLCLAGARKPEPQKLVVDPNILQTTGAFLQELGREVENAAYVDNLDEHLIERAEHIFDKHSRDCDFPAGFITRPVARLAIRPVINTGIRWITENRKQNEVDHAITY